MVYLNTKGETFDLYQSQELTREKFISLPGLVLVQLRNVVGMGHHSPIPYWDSWLFLADPDCLCFLF